jgi:hypothetical protein
MKPSVIVWDLETVPDLGGFAAANDLVGKSDVEVRGAIGDKFPKHIYHSIVCSGALIAHREPDHWAVDAVGAPHVGERTEKQLIRLHVRVEALRTKDPLADSCGTNPIRAFVFYDRRVLRPMAHGRHHVFACSEAGDGIVGEKNCAFVFGIINTTRDGVIDFF